MYTFTYTKTISTNSFYKMKKFFYSSLIIFTFFACGKKNNDPTPSNPTASNASFAFLKDNHQWIYDYDILGSLGTLSMLTDSISPNLYKVSSTYDSDAPDYAYWFVSGPYLKTYADGQTNAQAVIIYKSNPALNDSWSNTSATNSARITYYQVTNTDTTIVTSAGTFDHCKKIKVTFNYAFNTQYNFWNETHGLVYQSGYATLDLTSKNFRTTGGEQGYVRW